MNTLQENKLKRSFTPKARLISEIGDDLISSDTIALFELIKNSYDAGADYVKIEINIPLYDDDSLIKANSTIRITDNGHGMSLEELEDNFLAIGTKYRLNQREQASTSSSDVRIPLGEKGLGRFSAKRLGKDFLVESTRKGDAFVNFLKIDWRQYSHESDLDLDEVENEMWNVEDISRKDKSGTTLHISDLNELWDHEKIREIVIKELSKLMNPFIPQSFFIDVRYNGQIIDLSEMQHSLLSQAPYQMKGSMSVDSVDTPIQYEVTIHNKTSKRTITLQDMDKIDSPDIQLVGPLQFEIYEFSRTSKDLESISGFANVKEIRSLLDAWCGGIMVFRDNFRVMPYASEGDDWLELNTRFYRKGGITFNTIRTIGYVSISSTTNPHLIDQTNREGLQDNRAYQTFRKILQKVVQAFIDEIKNEERKSSDDEENAVTYTQQNMVLQQQIQEQIVAVRDEVDEALEAIIELSNNPPRYVKELKASLAQVQNELNMTKFAIETLSVKNNSYHENNEKLLKRLKLDKNKYQIMLELAGLGMIAEQMSHELNSLLDKNIVLVRQLMRMTHSDVEQNLLSQIYNNYRSLRNTTSYLEPLSNVKRRRKEKFNIYDELVTLKHYYPPIDSGEIQYSVRAKPPNQDITVLANKGMMIQVFDNLINNSIYWLKRTKQLRNDFEPKIEVEIDVEKGFIYFADNGIGVEPNFAKHIFEPFVTMKEEGRGLGLYIVREILNFHNCRIELLDERNSEDRLFKFMIDISAILT